MKHFRPDDEALYCVECKRVLPRKRAGRVLSDHECVIGPTLEDKILSKAFDMGYDTTNCTIVIGVCDKCFGW
jgi:hypothetical protein